MRLLTLAKRFNYTCYWCNRKWRLEDLSRDHIVPLNRRHRGGGDKYGKCVLSCIVCNSIRGNKPFQQFAEDIKNKRIFLK